MFVAFRNIAYVTVVLVTFKFQQIVRNWYSVQVTFVCTALWKIYLRSILPNLFKIRRVLLKLWRNTFWCVFLCPTVYIPWFRNSALLASFCSTCFLLMRTLLTSVQCAMTSLASTALWAVMTSAGNTVVCESWHLYMYIQPLAHYSLISTRCFKYQV